MLPTFFLDFFAYCEGGREGGCEGRKEGGRDKVGNGRERKEEKTNAAYSFGVALPPVPRVL